MKRFISVSLAIFLGLASAQEVAQPMFLTDATINVEDVSKVSCYLYDSFTFFDLRTLVGQYSVSSATAKYNFGLCQFATGATAGKTFAYSENLADGTQKALTDETLLPEHIYTKTNDAGVTYVQYIQASKTECKKDEAGKAINYQVTFNAMCDTEVTDATLKGLSVDDSNVCDVQINFSNAKGCPLFQATPIIAFIEKRPWIVGILLIVFGIISAFFGGKFFPKVLMAAFGGAVFTIAALLLSAIGMMKALDGDKSGKAIGLTILGFALALAAGIAAGWFINKIKRIAFMAVGGLAGFFVGFLFYTVLILKFYQATWLYVTILVVFIGLGAFIVFKKDKAIIVYLTAFLGGYALIRGISVFAGGYINEMTLAS
jgi:hypothetical protein